MQILFAEMRNKTNLTYPTLTLQEEDVENEKKVEEEQLQKEETEDKHLERVEEKVEEVPAEEKEKREV